MDYQVYFISYSKVNSNTSNAVYNKYLGVGFIVNFFTGVIEDICCTLLTKESTNFLKNMIVGYNIYHDKDVIVNRIMTYFNGESQRAICKVINENINKYGIWENNNRKILEAKKKDTNNSFVLDKSKNAFEASYKKYPEDSVYFNSYARVPKNMCLTFFEGYTGLVIIIDFKKDIIIDVGCTFLTIEAKEYFKSLLVGKSIRTKNDLNELEKTIKFYFNSPSQNANCMIVKSIYEKYSEWKVENEMLVIK